MKSLKTLLATTALAFLAMSSVYAQSASVGIAGVPEGTITPVLPTTVITSLTAPFDTRVNPKKNLSIRFKPSTAGNNGVALLLKNGTGQIISQSTAISPTAGGDGLTLNFSAPLNFDRFTISPTNLVGGTDASVSANQVR